MSENPSNPRSDAFIKVLKGLLRPLIRALIAQGVTAPAFYKLIKQTYVDVAEKDLREQEDQITDSRISVMTGVHRRDVKQMRNEDQTEQASLRAKVSTLTSVLGHWLGDPRFATSEGLPKELDRFGSGDGNSFESLVRSVSTDVRPRTVLDELVRQKLVELDDGDVVTLKADAFLGPADVDQRILFFSSNVGDHMAAATENLLAEEPPFLERAVFYNYLTEKSVDEIEEKARSMGNDLLLDLNKDAHARQLVDKETQEGTHRFRFGVFFYREDEGDKDDDPTGDET